jgi:hypothetical protein
LVKVKYNANGKPLFVRFEFSKCGFPMATVFSDISELVVYEKGLVLYSTPLIVTMAFSHLTYFQKCSLKPA